MPTPANLSLGGKQRLFTRLLGQLLTCIYDLGYEASIREVQRTPAQAALNAANGTGIANSLHLDSLAADIMIFKGNQLLTKSEDYEPFGVYWESLHPLCAWGGRFKKPDGNHFSVPHRGVR